MKDSLVDKLNSLLESVEGAPVTGEDIANEFSDSLSDIGADIYFNDGVLILEIKVGGENPSDIKRDIQVVNDAPEFQEFISYLKDLGFGDDTEEYFSNPENYSVVADTTDEGEDTDSSDFYAIMEIPVE